ncbi:hypothetical protein LJB85_03010 [Porphyromonadaceae bacterium OttesenSCG-928-L07]|nr:hypothetical protein [Porphyromonadaceae bacterium OttesenSCG-928-L07]MDL2251964.1 hypothetical protein [Odoribacter sp. OttesenSCG-928-J03]MDL2283296.1 hypothetical protein [Odoribacter sp. OttesenSCG-928-G04]
MGTNFKVLLVTLALAMACPVVYAQKSDKELKKELKAKADKDSRKTAKTLEKEGWKVMPGKLPLEKQIQESRYAEIDETETGERRFFIGTHQAVGGNYSAAKQIADSRAHAELAQSIYSVIAKKIEDQVASTDYGNRDLETIDEFVSASKTIISAQLSGITPVLEIYREAPKKQFEVMVSVKIDAEKALKMVKKGLYNELKAKSEKLAADLDAILPY